MPQQFTLKDGSTTTDRRLDRIAQPLDERRQAFLIRSALSEDQQQLVSNLWGCPAGTPVLDQGQQGACVGNGVTNELLWNPVPIPRLDETFAVQDIYWVAQRNDPWPGGEYPGASPQYSGTSVAAGIQAAADLGYYKAWHWGTTENEMALGVGHLGPAVIGVNWFQGMYEPDPNGYIHPTGANVGGHCLLVIGIDVKGGFYTLHNSWGASWGDQGNCKIKRKDMAKLIASNGEVCIITDRGVPAPTKAQAGQTAEQILPATNG